MNPLSFTYDFSSSEHGSPEERATTAELRIAVNDEVATRVDDSWARSVREGVRVSCYPMALWIASSWWRLRCEAPSTQQEQRLSWRMSHELAAAGAGYLWPRLTFFPDREAIDIECRPSRRVLAEPVRFLSSFRSTVPAAHVEKALAQFVDEVVARLDAMGVARTDLHDVWKDVRDERADLSATHFRELESQLGFDPDESPDSLVESVIQLEGSAGKAAVAELANAAGAQRAKYPNPAEFIRAVDELSRAKGMAARFDSSLRATFVGDRSTKPWERGRKLAASLRGALGQQRGRLNDDVLKQLLGGDFLRPAATSPVGLAVRTNEAEAVLHFRRANSRGRRFEVARIVAEQVLAPTDDRWLATTDAATARQKAQRAFAAEFLVPIAELKDRLGGDFSADELEAVADEYDVSSLTIESHLANNGIISPENVRAR